MFGYNDVLLIAAGAISFTVYVRTTLHRWRLTKAPPPPTSSLLPRDKRLQQCKTNHQAARTVTLIYDTRTISAACQSIKLHIHTKKTHTLKNAVHSITRFSRSVDELTPSDWLFVIFVLLCTRMIMTLTNPHTEVKYVWQMNANRVPMTDQLICTLFCVPCLKCTTIAFAFLLSTRATQSYDTNTIYTHTHKTFATGLRLNPVDI